MQSEQLARLRSKRSRRRSMTVASVPEGKVAVEWSPAGEGRLLVRWSETGGPAVKPPTRRGFGSRVIEQLVRGELQGEVRFEWRAEGLACEIAFQA
jgi:two-component sensor histidine kinase